MPNRREKVNRTGMSTVHFGVVCGLDLTQAMLLQEPNRLREVIARAKGSPHASTLAEEIRQAESALNRLK